jgi:hypothetical protein
MIHPGAGVTAQRKNPCIIMHKLSHLGEGGLFHDPLRECLTPEKPCPASRGYGLYYFHPLHPAKRDDGLKIIKPCCYRNKAFPV